MMGSMVLQERRVVDIPHYQPELYTATPIVRDAIRIRKAMLEIYRGLVDIIAKRKEEDTPVTLILALAM